MAPNPVPLSTQLSPGFTLNSAPVQGAQSSGSNGEPAASASNGPATSPIPTSGDSNPGPMTTGSAPLTKTSVSPFTLQSSHPPDPSDPATHAPSTDLSPGMTLASSATPSGVVTAVHSTVPGLGVQPSGFGGSVRTQPTSTPTPAPDLTSGTALASNAPGPAVPATAAGPSATGSASDSAGFVAQTTMPTAGASVATSGSLAGAPAAAVSSAGPSAGTSVAAGTSAGEMGAHAPGLGIVVALWTLVYSLGFFGRLRL